MVIQIFVCADFLTFIIPSIRSITLLDIEVNKSYSVPCHEVKMIVRAVYKDIGYFILLSAKIENGLRQVCQYHLTASERVLRDMLTFNGQFWFYLY